MLTAQEDDHPFKHMKINKVHKILATSASQKEVLNENELIGETTNAVSENSVVETTDFLVDVLDRVSCPNCHLSQKPYCTRCSIPLGHIPPRLTLPVKVVIIRHPQEKHGKSTSTHAKIIAPDQTSIIVHNMRDGWPPELTGGSIDVSRSLLLFPSQDAHPLHEFDPSTFDTLVVVDGTWSQAKMMTRMMSDAGLRHVKIEKHQTLFWRYQNFGDDYLATIEAIYYFFKDYSQCFEQSDYDGRYDNLLYYFAMQYDYIQHYYNHSARTFHCKKKQGYIKYQ